MKENDTLLRKEYMKFIRELVELVELINFCSTGCDCDCDCSNISFQKANKKVHILKLKFIKAFLLRDLELLKTLNKEYLECCSDLKSLLTELIKEINTFKISGENIAPINLIENWEISREIFNGNELKKQQTLIEFLEYYQSHH
jgi:hypothetical protein